MENSCGYISYADSYVHGEMDGRELSEFESHLSSCPFCTAEVENLVGIQRSIEESFSVSLDARFDYSVVTELRKEREKRPVREFRLALEDIIISLATLLVIVLIAIQLFDKPKVSSVDMVGRLDNIERSSLQQANLSNDQVLELVLRNK